MKTANFKINITEFCMLNCSYCPQTHENIHFSADMVEPLVKFFKGLERKISIDFFGGEPLTNLETIKKIIESCKDQCVPIDQLSVITNGVLATKDVIDYLISNGFYIQFSIDGDEKTHLLNRKDKDCRINSHASVLEAIEYMKSKTYQFGVYAVYHKNTISNLPKSLDFLVKLVKDPSSISMNPTIGYDWDESHFSELSKALEDISKDPKRKLYRKILHKDENDLICSACYIDHFGVLYPTNLFAYKNLSKGIPLIDVKEPKQVYESLIQDQEKLSNVEYDKEMKDQFKITEFVNNYFKKRRNMVIDSESVFEKKKWISITGLCNNNCIFCLDKGRPDTHHRDTVGIKKEIKQAYREGNTKLILSGGDPTTHPDLIDLVQYAGYMGFPKIQVITNGRMFSSRDFTDRIIGAGLAEVTFSIHGFNSSIHDSMTRVPGSLKQVIRGVQNVRRHQHMIINTDTCITRMNYSYLLKTIRFIVERLGIMEVNLMSMVPAGNAWKNRERVMYDYKEVAPYVRQVIDYCTAKGVVLWLSRFPGKYLKGYEGFIENPHKLVDEVRGRRDILKDTARPVCMGERCNHCSIQPICKDLIVPEEGCPYDQIMDLEQDTRSRVVYDKDKKYLLRLKPPAKRLTDYKGYAVRMDEAARKLKSFDHSNVYVYGIPQCVLMRHGLKNIVSVRGGCFGDYSDDILEYADRLSTRVMIKEESCDACIFNCGCAGVYRNYARLFGFGEILPIKSAEIRINNRCNQDCLFCNTDANAQNMVMDKGSAFSLVDEWSSQGYNYLVISGKEPTLEAWLADLIAYAVQKGFLKIELQTNAVELADCALSGSLIKAGLTHAFVSLHADTEELSREITKAPGTFEKTLKGIDNLKGIGLTVNVVVNSLNYRRLAKIVEMVHKRYNVQGIVFSVAAPVVKALENPEIVPDYKEITPYLKEAFDSCIGRGICFRIPSRCGIPLCLVDDYKEYHDEYLEPRFYDESDKVKLDACKDCAHCDICSGVWREYLKMHGPSGFAPVRRSRDIDINVGRVCNNNCRFCMTQDPDVVPRFADFDDLKRDVIYAAKRGYENVTFLGGEPTIYPRIMELVSLARRNGFETIHIVSNGRRFSDKVFLERLLENGVNRVSVSIHSHIEEVEDYLTGSNGGFIEKVRGLRNLAQYSEMVYINIVANKLNMDSLDESLAFFKEMGFENFRINSMMCHSGNSRINSRELVPSFVDMVPVIERVVARYPKLSIGDFPPCVFNSPQSVMPRIGEYLRDKDTSNIFYEMTDQKHKDIFQWKERRKNNLKGYAKRCEECSLYSECEGVWNQYLEIFGEEEFVPF